MNDIEQCCGICYYYDGTHEICACPEQPQDDINKDPDDGFCCPLFEEE